MCRSEWTNFQTWAAQTIEALLNQSHTPTGLDGCYEARGAVVLFRNWWPAFQRREQVGEPSVVLGIIGAGVDDKWLAICCRLTLRARASGCAGCVASQTP
jgi:hypothetical protein